MGDPFGTRALRARVLRAWAESPARFREDANAEEDLALGGYRDRVVVELAQNAADAAARDGVAGRLLLRLADGELRASNTGAPLDAAGVGSLATLRASAKREETTGWAGTGPAPAVGRFGVGFASVLALTDAPAVRSRDGGVRFDRAATAAACADEPALADVLAARSGHVPALRLPWPAPAAPDPGWTTTVVLPLRDVDADALARRLLGEVGPALLLALPALAEIVVEVDGVRRALHAARDGDLAVVVDDGVTTRWRLASRTGRAEPSLLADRPTEERNRPGYAVTWALPVDDEDRLAAWPGGVARVLHAPTPSDEPVTLPALLVATFPLDPSRRHVAEGPLSDRLVAVAAEAYVDLARAVPDPALVPRGLAAGALDGALRAAVVARLRDAAFLPGGVRPSAAVVLDAVDERLLDALGDVAPPALPPAWARDTAAVEALDVRRVALADLVDALAAVERPAEWWRRIYDALAGSPAGELGALPVPLTDGRLVRGPRGLLVPGAELPVRSAPALPVRLVDPAAAHPLLLRLGAVPATARSLLEDPAVAAVVREAADGGGPVPAEDLADAVLGLVDAAGVTVDDLPWLAGLLLPDDEGGLAEPAELALPGSPLAELAEPDAYGRPDPGLVGQVGLRALRAVGVRDTFPLVRLRDWTPGVDETPDLDDVEGWADDELGGGPAGAPGAALVPEHAAVGDLDLVRDDAWPQALARLAADRELRAAVVDAVPALVEGRSRPVRSYAAWWIRRHAVVDGLALTAYRLAGLDDRLAGLWPPLDLPGADGELLRAVGVRTTLEALLAEDGGPDELLARLADPSAPVEAARLPALYGALAGLDPAAVTPPDRLRAVRGDGTAVVDAGDVVVVDRPDLLPVVAGRAHLRVPLRHAAALAEVLDVATAGDRVEVGGPAGGTLRAVPAQVRGLVPGCPDDWVEHDELAVAGTPVEWLVADGEVHAATVAGLGRGLAWSAGRWEARHLLVAGLSDPSSVPELVVEAELDPGLEDGRG